MEATKNSWGWFFAWGIALIILGALAISYAMSTTIVSIIVLGAILAISGIVIIIDTLKSNHNQGAAFFLPLGIGVLYLLTGIMLIKGPIAGSITLTLLLAIFYIVIGLVRTVYCLSHSVVNKAWRLASSIITLLLGILILAQWPASGSFIIGLFIGVDLIFTGWLYMVAALAVKRT